MIFQLVLLKSDITPPSSFRCVNEHALAALISIQSIMHTVERMYVEVCWESRDAATTTSGRQDFSAVCSFHAFMFSCRVKHAFSSKRKAALGGFGVRIQTNSPRSSLYSRQTGVVWPSRSFVFDFQSDIRLAQVYMHTFTNNPKIIMTITKKNTAERTVLLHQMDENQRSIGIFTKKDNMTRERGLISAATLQNSSAAAEELPHASSDCCSGCHSSTTLRSFWLQD